MLRAGEDTAEGEYEVAETQHRPARVVGHWRGNPAGNDYHTLLCWDDAIYPQTIQVRYSADEGQLRLRGMTLIDQRTGTHHTLVVSSEGRYRLVHSGDVKIYQNLDVLPRAFVVHQARVIQDDESTIAAMQEESFEPDKEVILSAEGPSLTPSGGGEPDWVSIVSYEPERVIIETVLESPGYLVLTDAYYPGWQALVDGRAKEILRADYYFRAVYLTEGKHLVEFLYTPVSFKAGLTVSLVSLLILVGAVAWDLLRRKPSTTEEGQQGRLPK